MLDYLASVGCAAALVLGLLLLIKPSSLKRHSRWDGAAVLLLAPVTFGISMMVNPQVGQSGEALENMREDGVWVALIFACLSVGAFVIGLSRSKERSDAANSTDHKELSLEDSLRLQREWKSARREMAQIAPDALPDRSSAKTDARPEPRGGIFPEEVRKNMQFRVVSQSIPDYYHVVSVSDDGSNVSCSCPALGGFCSHIDAVLVANERAMVHNDDWEIADKARKLTLGKITAPAHWKGAWRGEFGWRGLKRQAANYNPRRSGRPLVCFTGTLPGKTRKQWLEEAVANGWDTTDEPSRFTDVLVAADPEGKSAKLKAARTFSTAIVNGAEWQAVMLDGVLEDLS